jgi:DNA recombination protein RmuC
VEKQPLWKSKISNNSSLQTSLKNTYLNGKPLKSDSEGKKMKPDAVIKYPDNRSVIIVSKVTLNAFTRLKAATEVGHTETRIRSPFGSY